MLNIYDCRDLSAKEIIEYMMELYPSLRYLKERRQTYIGATGDIAERLYRHNAADEVIFCARTAHRNVAAAVEALAHNMGFNIGDVKWGGNGTNSHSIYVYAYRITDDTVQ